MKNLIAINPNPSTKSNPEALKAIIQWPSGLDSPAVISPMSGTYEADEAIVRLLEKALGK